MTSRMEARFPYQRRFVFLAAVACAILVGCQKPTTQPCTSEVQLPPGMESRPLPPLATPHPAAKPAEETIALGTSVECRPIEAKVFGREGELTLIMGGFHGNEATGVEVCYALIRYLREHPALYQSCRIAVIPEVNPDGVAHRTRTNRNGVDINRNFPASNFPAKPPAKFAGGRRPASEVETHAVLLAIRRLQPARIVSIHSISSGRHGNNYDGPAHQLAATMSRHNGYPILPTMGYETPGSFGTWAGVDHRIPTITLELPRNASGAQCWEANREALLAAVRCPAPETRTLRAGANTGSHSTVEGK